MYHVTEAFKEAMKKPVQRFRLRGRIVAGPRTYLFTEDNVLEGSFSISNQCSDNENVQIGTVYAGELTATFVRISLQRYGLKGARITPEVELLTEDGYEAVPLGVYIVSEANWTPWGLEVTAYDNMSKFDKRATFSTSQGKIYDFLMLACGNCGVELGMTEEELERFPNGNTPLAIYPDNDIETWRDLVYWCAQTVAAFATMDRAGKLVLRQYGSQPVDTIDDYHRLTGAKFSDFETRYTGLSIVNMAEQTTSYYSLSPDNGLTYNLGSNPLIQYGLSETLAAQRTAILQAMSAICYVPMQVGMIGTPAYDLGDVLIFSEGIADAEKKCCITKYEWTYGGVYNVTGVGENPALASARSKTDKDITGLLAQINQDVIHYYDYINAESLYIGDGTAAEIIGFQYVTTKDTHIDFHAEVHYRIETTEIESDEEYIENDGVLKVTYWLCGEEIRDWHPIETKQDGEHILHLLYTWESSANIIGDFLVLLELEGGDVRIERGDARAYLAGQGLAGDAYDMGPTFTDNVDPIGFDFFGDVTDSVETQIIIPTVRELTENVSPMEFNVIARFADSAEATLGAVVTTYILDYVASATVTARDGAWSASENGQYIETVDVSGVVGFESYTGGMLSYMCSFDSGTTWYGWNGVEWQENLEMTYETARGLTTEELGNRSVRFKVIFDAGETCGGFIVKGGSL